MEAVTISPEVPSNSFSVVGPATSMEKFGSLCTSSSRPSVSSTSPHKPSSVLPSINELANEELHNLSALEASNEFLRACMKGEHEKMIQLLNWYGPSLLRIKAPDGRSALHFAACSGSPVTITELNKRSEGKLLGVKNIYLSNPLHFACFYGKLRAVQLLVDLSPALLRDKNMDGWSAFHIACRAGWVDLVRYLLSKDSSLVNEKTEVGATPLHLACFSENVEVVKELLNTGGKALISEKNIKGWNALHITCTYSSKLSILKELLRQGGASVAYEKNQRGNTALHLACQEGLTQALPELLAVGGVRLLFERNIEGDNCLHICCKYNRVEAAKYFLSLAQVVNGQVNLLRDRNLLMVTPLHIACHIGNANLVIAILQHDNGAKDERDGEGNTALHYACHRGAVEVVKELIKMGANPLLPNLKGRTPIQLASERGFYYIVQLAYGKQVW